MRLAQTYFVLNLPDLENHSLGFWIPGELGKVTLTMRLKATLCSIHEQTFCAFSNNVVKIKRNI